MEDGSAHVSWYERQLLIGPTHIFHRFRGCAILYTFRRTVVDNLLSLCWLDPGTIEHEFLHALGLSHTQNRFDRDNYVQIVWQNVQGGRPNTNFWKHGPYGYLGLPYDYLSVMHYREADWGINGGITIKTRDQRYQNYIGKSPGVSRGDLCDVDQEDVWVQLRSFHDDQQSVLFYVTFQVK